MCYLPLGQNYKSSLDGQSTSSLLSDDDDDDDDDDEEHENLKFVNVQI